MSLLRVMIGRLEPTRLDAMTASNGEQGQTLVEYRDPGAESASRDRDVNAAWGQICSVFGSVTDAL
jgi:hypothetical protein